jgi:uncharacterized protein (TIGR00369 family)
VKFPPPVAELIGFVVEEAGDGESLLTMVAEERHSSPLGTIHGGILCDLADAAMGVVMFSSLEPGESFTTLELKINYLRPFWTGKLIARGRIAHRGKTVAMVECDVFDEQERLIARSSSTCMVLRGEMAAGR